MLTSETISMRLIEPPVERMEDATEITGVGAHAAAAAAAVNAVQEAHVHMQMEAASLSHAATSMLGMDGVVGSHALASPQAPALPKKTGRPAHPLWAHFHRGEKRNRYHYHAFCVYCVERYGAEQVPPTRGVSIDMLRHLEKCAHCPRRTVEHLKEVCGRRDAVRFDRYGKKKLIQQQQLQQQQQQQQQEGEGAAPVGQATDQSRALGQVSDHVTMIQRHHEQQQQQQEEQFKLAMAAAQASAADVPASSIATSQAFLEASAISGSQATITPSLMATAAVAMPSPSFSPTSTHESGATRPHDQLPSPPAKRLRGEDAVTSFPTTNSQIAVLKLAVAAGIPVDALQNQDFQQLLCLLRPSLASPLVPTSETFGQMLEPTFLKETAQRLASLQLDRVKEGMLNSTIKGGLTLSLHSWTTLDGQHLVAFNLVNSNGDSTCVRVEDLANVHTESSFPSPHANTATSVYLAAKIEDVLAKLQTQNISVMGIVADSTLALNAARRVSLTMNKRQSLLVVPCFSRVLSVLAGAVLSHPHFVPIVGTMIEIAAYLLNTKLLERVRQISGDPQACFVLPNRENWFSFVECHSSLLRYRHAIMELCKSDSGVPHVLKTLVLRDNQTVWAKLDELGAFLAPLHETYSVFFQQIRTVPEKSGEGVHGSTSVEVLEDDVSAAHGLTLAHVTYQFARMTQLYQSLLLSAAAAPDAQDVAQLVLIHVDTMWRRYELPAMLLAFVFNFHLETTLLDMSKPCSAWPSIAQYFQLYYQRWFGQETSVSAGGTADPTTSTVITTERIAEILDAIKLNHFPFDPDTTSDYVDVSSFYSFVSDSHPEICALCCRLYAISLLTANVSRVVRGIGYVPNAAQTTRDPESVELLLHIGFASSMRRNVFPASNASDSSLGGMEALIDSGASDAVLWSEDIWQGFADDWRLFVDQELLMDEFDAISNECACDDTTAALLAVVKVPVQDLFVDTLPAMTVTLEKPQTPGLVVDTMASQAAQPDASNSTETAPGVVISVGI